MQKKYYSFNLKIFFLGIFLILPILFFLDNNGFSSKSIILILAIPVISIMVFDYNLFKYLFIISLFSNYFIYGLYVSVFIALAMVLSFIISYRNIDIEIFKTPLTIPVIIYYLTILPSLLNSTNILLSLYLLINFHTIVLLMFILGYTLKSYAQIRNILFTFILFVFFDAIVLIILGLIVGGREFGVTGVVYVDYSVMAILSLLLLIIFKQGKTIFFYLWAIIIIFAGLIFTQTRNTFISMALAAATIFLYLIFNRRNFDISVKKLFGTFSTIIAFALLVVVLLTIISPDTFERFDELNQKSVLTIKSESDFTRNSLLTRLLIWDTALNAFISHPVVGIGAYSFPFESVNYYTISKGLFKDYVEGLSPHITYLAILTETGILGFMGFMIFLISSIRLGLKSIHISVTGKQKFYSLLILSLQIYIFYSMFLSDAWLWGQCGLLWSLILGLSVANYKIIKNSKIDLDFGK